MTEPIAIIGASARFPGAPDLAAYWQLLAEGRQAIAAIPLERRGTPGWSASSRMAAVAGGLAHAGLIDEHDAFDCALFGMSPQEASAIDPQHRMLLEMSWAALEDAGIAPDRVRGSNAGIFVALSNSDFDRLVCRELAALGPDSGSGTSLAGGAGRLAYVLDTRGPSLTIDTACTGSLVALHVACQSLRLGECDLALVGGANLLLSPEKFVTLALMGTLSEDGRCRSFSESSSGTVRGEGCGMLVLRRNADALRSHDRIRALVTGSAVSQVGRGNGPMAPGGSEQMRAARVALAQADTQPAAVDYVEAHGSGTPLGDSIELRALDGVYGDGRVAPLAVGSVKSNIGHLEAAGGVAAVIKVLLSLEHDALPATVGFMGLNPLIRVSPDRIAVIADRREWKRTGSRSAAVHSYGASGSNVHVILQESPARPANRSARVDSGEDLLVLSAASAHALRALAVSAEQLLEGSSDREIRTLCEATRTGRASLPHRLALVGKGEELAAHLRAYRSGAAAAGILTGPVKPVCSNAFGIAFGSSVRGLGEVVTRLGQNWHVLRAHLDQTARVFADADAAGALALARVLMAALGAPAWVTVPSADAELALRLAHELGRHPVRAGDELSEREHRRARIVFELGEAHQPRAAGTVTPAMALTAGADASVFLTALGHAFAQGLGIDWTAFWPRTEPPITLPKTPFVRQPIPLPGQVIEGEMPCLIRP
jgi:acyl transferase domain-containing protein